MACVLVAECITTPSPHFGSPFVVKICDPHYSARHRKWSGLGDFRVEDLAAIARLVSNGKYQMFAEQFAWTFQPYDCISAELKECFSSFTSSTTSPFPMARLSARRLEARNYSKVSWPRVYGTTRKLEFEKSHLDYVATCVRTRGTNASRTDSSA